MHEETGLLGFVRGPRSSASSRIDCNHGRADRHWHRRWGSGASRSRRMLPLMQQALELTRGGCACIVELRWVSGRCARVDGARSCSVADFGPRGARSRCAVHVAMGLTDALRAWLVLRFLAGIASACVLVGVSGGPADPRAGRAGRLGRDRCSRASVSASRLRGRSGLAAGVFQIDTVVRHGCAPCAPATAAVIAWPALRRVGSGIVTPVAWPERGVPAMRLVLLLCRVRLRLHPPCDVPARACAPD